MITNVKNVTLDLYTRAGAGCEALNLEKIKSQVFWEF